jgi:Holliday junction DNA helicase RuvB
MNPLRPTRLDDLLGQKSLIEALEINILSAKSRGTCIDHSLLYGPPGTGKTTVANAVANEMGSSLQVANGANLRTIKTLIPYVMRIEENSVLFIDEIHRMTSLVEEFLYPIMEDFKLDMATESKEFNGETLSMEIPRFTLLGATTEYGSLSKPLIDRFKHKHTLSLYNIEDLLSIVRANAERINVPMSECAMRVVAETSRGTPRIANAGLEWVRDYHIAKGISRLSGDDVEAAMAIKGIDKSGMTQMDREYLKVLKKYGKPMGIETIVSISGFDRNTIEGIIEPWLLQKGKIIKTSKGRIVT